VRLGSTPNYTYVLTGTAQTTWTFDADGTLQEVRDAQGHTTTLSYTTTVTCTNVLARVTGPDADGDPDTGRHLAFSYDDACRLVEVRDHATRTVAFAYDQSGDLTVVTDTRGLTWTYTYSGSHLLYEVWDPNGHLVERTAYDAEGRAVRQWVGRWPRRPWSWRSGGLTRVVTDARGISQTVVYDARNAWAGTLDAAGNPSTRSYDANFNLGYLEDANGNPTEIDWNACGCRPVQITDALDGETTMTYDDRNNLETYTDAGDHTTSYYYAPGTSLLVSTTNELELTSYYTYSDGLSGVPDGLLLAMQAPGNQYTRYQYDAYGQNAVHRRAE
jgi:RHS Repeat.